MYRTFSRSFFGPRSVLIIPLKYFTPNCDNMIILPLFSFRYIRLCLNTTYWWYRPGMLKSTKYFKHDSSKYLTAPALFIQGSYLQWRMHSIRSDATSNKIILPLPRVEPAHPGRGQYLWQYFSMPFGPAVTSINEKFLERSEKKIEFYAFENSSVVKGLKRWGKERGGRRCEMG